MGWGTGLVQSEDLRNRTHVFRNRAHAGQVLASLLSPLRGQDVVVLAVPAGGVPVAVPIASALSWPLACAVVSKMTLPHDTERGFGALAFDGTYRLNEPLVEAVGLSVEQVREGVAHTREKVERRVRQLEEVGAWPIPSLEGRTAVIVDDGLASGFTMSVAVEAVRHAKPERVLVAVPTGHERAARRMTSEADGVVCANVREGLSFAVAEAYEHWYDVSEDEFLALLREA